MKNKECMRKRFLYHFGDLAMEAGLHILGTLVVVAVIVACLAALWLYVYLCHAFGPSFIVGSVVFGATAIFAYEAYRRAKKDCRGNHSLD